MHYDNSNIIPGLARLGGELYLKTKHPFKYAQMLLDGLNEQVPEFTDAIQAGLVYVAEFLHEIEHYRFDVAQPGFREYLTFKRHDILQDDRLNSTEQQELIAMLYNAAFLIDYLETLHKVAKDTFRDDLMRDILRPVKRS